MVCIGERHAGPGLRNRWKSRRAFTARVGVEDRILGRFDAHLFKESQLAVIQHDRVTEIVSILTGRPDFAAASIRALPTAGQPVQVRLSRLLGLNGNGASAEREGDKSDSDHVRSQPREYQDFSYGTRNESQDRRPCEGHSAAYYI